MVLLHSTLFYFILLWLYFTLPYMALLHSTIAASSLYLNLYTSLHHAWWSEVYRFRYTRGSTSFYMTVLHCTMALLDSAVGLLYSTWLYSLYQGSNSVYFTLFYSTIGIIHSTWLQSTMALLHCIIHCTSMYYGSPSLYFTLPESTSIHMALLKTTFLHI